MVLLLSRLFPFVCAVTLLGLFSWHPITLETSPAETDQHRPATPPSSLRDRVAQASKDAREHAPFPKVVVLNLATRKDRRDHMRSLADVHDLDMTFINATSYASPEIIWIHERLYDDANDIAWGPSVDYPNDTWRSHFLKTPSASLQPPPSPSLPPAVQALVAFPAGTEGVDSLPGPLACYVTHLSFLRRMVDEGWGPTIVLEDDVDLEWKFKERWSEVVDRSLPEDVDWHLLYLGYSFTREDFYEPIHSPFLRPSHDPLGTYAYALSPSGARALLAHALTYEPLFSKPIDHVYRDYVALDHQVHASEPRVMSFVPPVVAHGGGAKAGLGSDIGGLSYIWQSLLSDSTVERLERFNEVGRVRQGERQSVERQEN